MSRQMQVSRNSSNLQQQNQNRRQNLDSFLHTNSTEIYTQPTGFSQHAGKLPSSLLENDGMELSFGEQEFGSYAKEGVLQNHDDLVFSSQFTPSLLDLNLLDTELLPDISILGFGQGTEDPETYLSTNKAVNRSRGLPENNLLRCFSSDKEKANNVAKIKVVVRKRPLNKKETAKREEDIITIEQYSNVLAVHEKKFKVDLTEYVEKHEFIFDAVLNEDVSNDEVYTETVEPVIPLIFQRIKATCFAYGQTGSGKTYTMQPLPLKACEDILGLMHHSFQNQGFQLFVSFFEIYGGKLFDLLNDRKKLFMREDGKQQVCIVGLQEYRVSDVGMITELIEKGNASRSTGTTGANEESSRSHAILQLCIKKPAEGKEAKPPRPVGKLSFIDLAGSERGADTTDNDKQTRIEGADINKSLLALKECIRALDSDQIHIPFRGSKLTEVLRDSFMGDSRTVMISCISPSSGSCEHTLNTLRYADRVKSLSKGNLSKKDPLASSSSLRDSTALPLSSVSSNDLTIGDGDDATFIASEKNRFGWSKQRDRELPPPIYVDRVPSGRIDGSSAASMCSDSLRIKRGSQNDIGEYNDDYLGKIKSESQVKWRDPPEFHAKKSSPDDDLSALLKEEENLVFAHRRQVEETIDIVREEMNLLFQVDQPGNPLDEYVSKLNAILSQKAAAILQLQTQLTQFQRHLDEYNVLGSSKN